jgi:heme/copper-type cytochrome/quinol oxidase subunit 4
MSSIAGPAHGRRIAAGRAACYDARVSFAAETAPRPSGWLANAPVDVAMAFGWLPFYLALLTTPMIGTATEAEFTAAFRQAAIVALSATFVHRHFVYFLFFGDARQRARHPQALWAAPLLVLAVVLPTRMGWTPGVGVVIAAIAVWNIWHTLMQRHGIARAYAARGGGGLEARAHARRDVRLLWALAACTAAFMIVCRAGEFRGPAQQLFPWVLAVQQSRISWALLGGTAMAAVAMAFAWIRAEGAARPHVARGPRLLFWASTVCLLGVFAVHGPLMGYLVFGFSHAVEYVLFVHVFARGRMARGDPAPSARLFGRTVPFVVLSVLLFGFFAAARQVWTLPLFAVYYTATSALHFFYDGLIWKMRRPEVRVPIAAWAGSGP